MTIDSKTLELIVNNDEKLTDVRLISQELTSEDAVNLMAACKNNTVVATLNLYNNYLRDAGVKAIADNLNTTCITTLNVGNNQITIEGAKLLAGAIKTNTTLTSLDLYANNISDGGIQSFAEAVQFNPFIIFIDIGWNNPSTESIKKLNSLLKRNEELAKFNDAKLKSYQAALALAKKNAKREEIINAFLLAQQEAEKENQELLSCIATYLSIYKEKRKKSSTENSQGGKSSPPKSSPSTTSRRLLDWMTGKPPLPQPKPPENEMPSSPPLAAPS